MTDRPILFSGSMIRSNRRSLKTNTRRELKPQPKVLNNGSWYRPFPQDRSNWQYALGGIIHAYAKVRIVEGDRLWVRETWSHTGDHVFSISEARRCPFGYPIYQADENPEFPHAKFWPSIHMPREFSRMTLIVTGVKIERLQSISREDAIAEGLEWVSPTYGIPGIASTWNGDPRESYFALWDHINGAGAAAKNPWVACYTYSVHHCNIDAMSKEAA